MHPMGFHGFHHGAHPAIDWSKIEPEHRWILLTILVSVLCLLFGAVACIVYFDDAPAPPIVRQVLAVAAVLLLLSSLLQLVPPPSQ